MNHISGFLWRGAVAGAVAGGVAALYNLAFTRAQINEALAIEEANAVGDEGEPMFSRATQVFGGVSALVLFGILVGVVFAVALAVLWRNLPGPTAFNRAIALAMVGYVSWVLVPGLKYPPNPPAVGDPDTVGSRTAAYSGLLIASLVVAYATWILWQRLTAASTARGVRFAVAGGAYAVAIGVLYLVFPANPDEIEVPAQLIWQFRINSLAALGIMWLVMGTTFGILADRRSSGSVPGPVVEREVEPA